MARAQQAARDFARRAVARLRLQRVAAEQVHLFELREQSFGRCAARRLLQLMHGQELTVVEAVGVELGAVVEVTRNDERIADHATAPRCAQPVCLAALHQFNVPVLAARQVAYKSVFFVRRIDGDGAHRFECGVGNGGFGVRRARQQQSCSTEGNMAQGANFGHQLSLTGRAQSQKKGLCAPTLALTTNAACAAAHPPCCPQAGTGGGL